MFKEQAEMAKAFVCRQVPVTLVAKQIAFSMCCAQL